VECRAQEEFRREEKEDAQRARMTEVEEEEKSKSVPTKKKKKKKKKKKIINLSIHFFVQRFRFQPDMGICNRLKNQLKFFFLKYLPS